MSHDCDASHYGNDPELELEWVKKSCHHADTYYNLLTSLDSTKLKLTTCDDVILAKFREVFPDLDTAVISEDEMKSKEGKEKWRPFCMEFEDTVEDFNYGTLLRVDSTQDYNQANTIFVPRIQFLAIEIARNRQGQNTKVKGITPHTDNNTNSDGDL